MQTHIASDLVFIPVNVQVFFVGCGGVVMMMMIAAGVKHTDCAMFTACVYVVINLKGPANFLKVISWQLVSELCFAGITKYYSVKLRINIMSLLNTFLSKRVPESRVWLPLPGTHNRGGLMS